MGIHFSWSSVKGKAVQGPHEDSRANHVTAALERAGVNPSLTLQTGTKELQWWAVQFNSFRAQTTIKELAEIFCKRRPEAAVLHLNNWKQNACKYKAALIRWAQEHSLGGHTACQREPKPSTGGVKRVRQKEASTPRQLEVMDTSQSRVQKHTLASRGRCTAHNQERSAARHLCFLSASTTGFELALQHYIKLLSVMRFYKYMYEYTVIVWRLLWDICDRWSGGHTCIREHTTFFCFQCAVCLQLLIWSNLSTGTWRHRLPRNSHD